MAKKVNPALFIGLGGTGYKILLQVKKSLLLQYGEIPPCIKILCFDTDVAPLQSAEDELTYIPKEGTKMVTKKIRFEKSEYITIPVKNPHKLKNSNYIKKWLSEKVEPIIVPGANGARQIRQLGRFAFFENYSTQRINETIQGLLHDIMQIGHSKVQDYEITGSEPKVHMVFSPCGGTGAGTFLDMAMTIKTDPISMGYRVNAWMVGPDFYTSFPATHSVVKNAYAVLKEMDHLLGKDNTKDKPWSNYNADKPFTVDYGNGVALDLQAAKFLDFVYLFDNVMKDGKTIDRVEDVYARIGSLLYLMVSGAGDDIFETMASNMEMQDMTQPSSDITGKKRRNYSSIGISQIIMDRNYIRDHKILGASSSILNQYLQPGKESTVTQEDCDAFIDGNQLREDKGEDQIIDRLFAKTDLKYDIEGLLPAEMGTGSHEELSQNTSRFLSDWDSKVQGLVDERQEQVINSFIEVLDSRLMEMLKQPGSIAGIKIFLSTLDGSFEVMKNEMDGEATGHKATVDKLKKGLEAYLEAIREAEGSMNPFGKSGRIRTECMNYLGSAEKILADQCDLARKSTAKMLLTKMHQEIEKRNSQIVALDGLFSEANKSLASALQQLRNRNTSEHDYERYIHQYAEDIVEVTPDIQEAMNSIDFSDFLGAKKVENITGTIRTYVETTGDITEVENLTVEKVLESLDEKTVKIVINYLDNASQVCLQIDENFASETTLPKMTKLGFICVADDETSIFKKGSKYLDQIGAGGGYNTKPYTTGNRDRITMVKSEGTFPACSIVKMKEYKYQYDLSVKYGNFHQSDTYFDDCMDLFKDDSAKDAMLYFGIGSALDIIECKARSGYIIKMPGEEKDLFAGGSKNKTDRAHAFNYFKKVNEYVEFIKGEYERMAGNDPMGIKKYFFDHFHHIYEAKYIKKQKGSLSDREQAHLRNERKEVANFAIYEGEHMTTTEYMQSKDNGTITEVCTEKVLRDAGIEL